MSFQLPKDSTVQDSTQQRTIKFANGIMVFTAIKQYSVSFAKSGNGWRATINPNIIYDHPFIEIPMCIVSTANNADYTYCNISGVIRNEEMISSITVDRINEATIGTVNFMILAIGRWK